MFEPPSFAREHAFNSSIMQPLNVFIHEHLTHFKTPTSFGTRLLPALEDTALARLIRKRRQQQRELVLFSAPPADSKEEAVVSPMSQSSSSSSSSSSLSLLPPTPTHAAGGMFIVNAGKPIDHVSPHYAIDELDHIASFPALDSLQDFVQALFSGGHER
jgi:hypothetical protein